MTTRALGLVALICLLLPAAPASADTETIVLTPPYASADTRTACGEPAGCILEASADSATGQILAVTRVAGAHVDVGLSERAVSFAEGTIVATHALAEEAETEITSITYRVEVTLAPTDVGALPEHGRVTTAVVPTHDSGAVLEGARFRTPFIGGIIRHNGGTTSVMELTVTGEDGAPIPPGQISLAISMAALVDAGHTVHCGDEGCVTEGESLGNVSTGMTVRSVTATIERS
jgi:hypothetical protein